MSSKNWIKEVVNEEQKSSKVKYRSIERTEVIGSWFEKEIFGMKENKRHTKHLRFTVGKALAKPKEEKHPVKELAIGFNDWVRKLRSILHIPRKSLPVLPATNQNSTKSDIEIQSKTKAGDPIVQSVPTKD